jgi:hypothetical protein
MLITNLKVDCYSTGCYGEKNADGLTLQFMVEDAEIDDYTIFNVDCSRSRGPSKGAKRPSGQFSVRKKHSSYKFWHHTCGLPTLYIFKGYRQKPYQCRARSAVAIKKRIAYCTVWTVYC